MRTYNNGRNYENFVASLQNAILKAESENAPFKNINIEQNKIIFDNYGTKREFDIYWKFEIGGLVYETIIECKDYNSSVSIDRIDSIIGKVQSIPNLRVIFATTKGYQSGAKLKAERCGIELLVIREQNDSDWTDRRGNPYLRHIHIESAIQRPARIDYFEPIVDYQWVKDNTSYTKEDISLYKDWDNKIFIDDLIENKKYSLYELSNSLSPIGEEKYGKFEQRVELKNAFFETTDYRLKILGYTVKYTIFKPYIMKSEIDFSSEILGVVENIHKETKQIIFKGGHIITD